MLVIPSHKKQCLSATMLLIWAIVWLSVGVSSGRTRAADVTQTELRSLPVPRMGDEVWEVSSRALPDLQPCTSISPVNFRVAIWNGCQWIASDESGLQASLASNPLMRTIIYSHGNWMTHENSRGRGRYVYNRVSQRADEPIRFIMYSWPSQRDGRPVRDVYEKADRSNTDTYYFAHLLSRLPAESPLGIIGFSFGGRVVCGGLHMVSGGVVEGRRSPAWEVSRQVRVGLVAPAFDRTWLAANKSYGQAMNNVDKLVNIYNSQDPVLRRFRFIDRVSAPIAAGFTGLADPRATEPLSSDDRIRQMDCGASVGSSHDEMTYYRKCCHYNTLIDNVLGK